MALKSEISDWFDRGVEESAAYLIVVCDTFDHEDYPVFAKDDREVAELYKQYQSASMQRVEEVYDLRGDKEIQMSEHHVMRLPTGAD